MPEKHSIDQSFPFDGQVSLLFMAGYPVKQVQTPGILNQQFLESSLKRLVVPVDVQPAAFPDYFASLRSVHNCAGMLVTVPHKEALFELCEKPSPRAALLGFANVARPSLKGGYESDCLDGEALMVALRERSFSIESKSAIIAGCGGAGAAYAASLADNRIASLTLLDHNSARAQSLLFNLTKSNPEVSVKVGSATESKQHDLIINATPVGMKSDTECVFSESAIEASSAVVDATTPYWRTLLIASATLKNKIAIDGKMLAQAQASCIVNYFWST
jgi:shikimate dehydrogenase